MYALRTRTRSVFVPLRIAEVRGVLFEVITTYRQRTEATPQPLVAPMQPPRSRHVLGANGERQTRGACAQSLLRRVDRV